jgi:branched-chain amino acid transport system substrate-binding protein
LSRKLVVFLILISIVLLFIIWLTQWRLSYKEKSQDIKIGVVLPFSGTLGTLGKFARQAAELAVSEINDDGGISGKKIVLVFRDDRNKPLRTAEVVRDLIEKRNVQIIIGSLTTEATLAGAQVAETKNVLMLTSSATGVKVTQGKKNIFRTCFTDTYQGLAMAKFASQRLGVQRAAVIYDIGSEYSKSLAQFFEEKFKALGGKVVASELYTIEVQDFKNQLSRIKKANPDFLFIPDYYEKVAKIVKQAREMGIEAVVAGGDGWASRKLLELAGKAVEGGYFTDHFSVDDPDRTSLTFVQNFEARYGREPNAVAALTYDTLYLLADALRRAGSQDVKKLRRVLEETTNFKGVTGAITFDANHNAIKPVLVFRISDQKQIFVERVEPD